MDTRTFVLTRLEPLIEAHRKGLIANPHSSDTFGHLPLEQTVQLIDQFLIQVDVQRQHVVASVDHPTHYGGADNPYEAIKVIEAWSLGFCLGNAVKYICRAGKKHKAGVPQDDLKAKLEDLKKARWYLDREIQNLERPR